jgi:hypothetical protein
MSEGPIVKEPTPEEDRVRPLPLVGVAVGSLVVGFLLVYALGQSAAEAGRARTITREPREPPRRHTGLARLARARTKTEPHRNRNRN